LPRILRLTRRQLLRGASALSAYAALGGGCTASVDPGPEPGRVGSRPFRNLPEGTDTLPQIAHVVVLMMENHSFDNYFGMLDPSVGFTLDASGAPTASCPDGMGHHIRAFHMPSTCQLDAEPSQAWDASHASYADGRNDGFVTASGPVAMGYWDETDLPFYYSLARNFTLASRWFGSTLCQTYPNRRFLMAGTASGIIRTDSSELSLSPPPNGTIFDRLDAHGITWRDYASDLPGTAVLPSVRHDRTTLANITGFMRDAAAGALPSVSFVDPPFTGDGSEENPQDIRVGERFASQIIQAVMNGPAWGSTMLVWLYDEHGGYYDHVPPPDAIPPDDIAPILPAGEMGAYDRYGFRVPAVIVSPYAKPGYVSSVVRDHTSVLRFIERKWNLGALTLRDAAADDLTDCLDFDAAPRLLTPPTLAAPALAASSPPPCTPGSPGTIPPPEAVLTGRADRLYTPMGRALIAALRSA
jgi:phospholipase C